MPPQLKETTSLLNDDDDNNNYDNKRYLSLVLTDSLVGRASVIKRHSFVHQFLRTNGAPQLVVLNFLLAVGLGSTIGVVPAVMTDRYARLHYNFMDERDCSEFTIVDKPTACLDGSADAQNAVAFASFVSYGLQFLSSALIGTLSDIHGRKLFLLLGVFMSALSPVCLVVLQLRPQMNPVWYYSLGVLTGLFSWMTVALSALSDIMPPEWRAASYGFILAGVLMGFCVAPFLSLVLDHFKVSVLSASLVVIGWFLSLFFFPETLSPETAIEAEIVREEKMQGLTLSGRILFYFLSPIKELSILNRSRLIRMLSILAFFSGFVAVADQSLLLYYLEERLDFNERDVANLFLIMGGLGIAAQGLILKPLTQSFGEKYVVVIAFFGGVVTNALYGLAKNKITIFIATSIGTLSVMAFPAISALKSNNVEKSEQGLIQGALLSVQSLASAVGPVTLRFVYHKTSNMAYPGPGSMFLFAAVVYLGASVLACALPTTGADSNQATPKKEKNIQDRQENPTAQHMPAFVNV